MTERRTLAPDGQRKGDQLLRRVGQFIVIAGAVATGFAFVNDKLAQIRDNTGTGKVHTAQIDSLKTEVKDLRVYAGATAYMACVTFAETHPAKQVPVFCDGQTRGNGR